MSASYGSWRPPTVVPRTLFTVGLATALTLTALTAPAAATVYSGSQSFPGDLALPDGDVVLGDLQVEGTLTVPQGATVTVSSTQTVTLAAARIVIAGTLDGRGGAGDAGSGRGGQGSATLGNAACAGGGGGGSASAGGAGGYGGLVPGAGGPVGLPYLVGPGSAGGDGASSCSGNFQGGIGGYGGAGIHLVAPLIEISGTVRADGTAGQPGSGTVVGRPVDGSGGGGSGGEIRLSGTTVLSGTLSAVGGPGGFGGLRITPDQIGGGGGGGGSGGRIHVDGGPLIGRPGYVLSANQAVAAPGGIGNNSGDGHPGGLGQVPTVTAAVGTTASVSSSLNPSTSGQNVEFTAAVDPSAATGSVGFSADGTPLSGCASVTLVSGGAVCSTAALAVGTHTIEAVFTPSDPIYEGSSGSLSGGQGVRPAAIPQSITFPAQVDRVIGAPPFALVGVVGGGSGNPVTFTSAGPCSVSGGTVALTDVGTCTVTADQAGGGGYLPAPSVGRSFAVGYGQRVLSVSAGSQRGAAVAMVLQLTDAAGRNLSSAAVRVRATAIDGGPLGVVLTLDPANNFPYSTVLNIYTFTAFLRTGLSRGQHTLSFTAGADPRLHSVVFTTV